MNPMELKQSYIDELNEIKQKKCSNRTKIKLIQGLMQKLRSINSNPQLLKIRQISKTFCFQTPQTSKSLYAKKNYVPQQCQSTSYSFCSQQQSIMQCINTSQQYQERIMQKRVVKFEINEQIQALEDDLFQIEKVIETKRIFNDQLAKDIQKQMKEIGEKTERKTKQECFTLKTKEDVFNLSHSYSGFRNITNEQYSLDMNATVSGASGLGIVKRNNETSINNSPSINQSVLNLSNIDSTRSPQRKKSKSYYLSKGFTGIFKNILK